MLVQFRFNVPIPPYSDSVLSITVMVSYSDKIVKRVSIQWKKMRRNPPDISRNPFSVRCYIDTDTYTYKHVGFQNDRLAEMWVKHFYVRCVCFGCSRSFKEKSCNNLIFSEANQILIKLYRFI